MGTPTIVAMGGGGFMMEPDEPALDDFVFSLSGSATPRVCFVPTAAGDCSDLVDEFTRIMSARGADPTHLPLFSRSEHDLRNTLFESDIIYVGGGNTANMLAIWRVHGVDRLLAEAWQRGTVLCGVSAGMLCWFEGGITDSFGPVRALRDGLGLLKGTACPHYDSEPERRPLYRRLVGEGLPGGYAAEDGAALVFYGTEYSEAVASRPGARAYNVRFRNGRVIEEELAVRVLVGVS